MLMCDVAALAVNKLFILKSGGLAEGVETHKKLRDGFFRNSIIY